MNKILIPTEPSQNLRTNISFELHSLIIRFRCTKRKGVRRYDDRVRCRSQRPMATFTISKFVGDRATLTNIQPSIERHHYTERYSRRRFSGGSLAKSSRNRNARWSAQATLDGPSVRLQDLQRDQWVSSYKIWYLTLISIILY